MPEPVLTSGSQQNHHTVEEHSVHRHLHANVAKPNSCYMDDIYCCNSFTIAVTVVFADSKGYTLSQKKRVLLGGLSFYPEQFLPRTLL